MYLFTFQEAVVLCHVGVGEDRQGTKANFYIPCAKMVSE